MAWTFVVTVRMRSSRKEQKHRLGQAAGVHLVDLEGFLVSGCNTYLFRVAVFTVTELQVIFQHAGKKRIDSGEFERTPSNLGGI